MPLSSNPNKGIAARVALMGLLFALAMVLSFVEGLLPVLPALPPGVKLGLSNIVVLYAAFFLNAKNTITLAVLKSLFILLTRGVTSGLISLGGGLASVLVMLLLLKLSGRKVNFWNLSILGAIAHNLGQLLIVRMLLGNALVWGYLPFMLLGGIGFGLLTGTILKLLYPYLNTVNKRFL